MTSDVYFGADTTQKCIDRIEREIQNWGTTTTGSSIFQTILAAYWRNVAAYYSTLIEPTEYGSALGYTGEKGELVRLLIPKARTLIRQFAALATRQRYAFDVVTDVNNSSPLQIARLGKAICQREIEEHQLDILAERIAENCAVKGMCWVSNTWDTSSGPIWARKGPNSAIFTGGTKVELHDLHETCFNWGMSDEKSLQHWTVKRRMNRWDLIAEFPEMTDQIKNLPTVRSERMIFPVFNHLAVMDDEDHVLIREFYHRPSPALPQGRMLIYGDQNTVFYDDVNPYEGIPAVLFRFQPLDNTLLGYPLMSSMLPAQQMLDHEVSVISTNHSAFGTQSVLVPKGSDISVEDIKEGASFISYTPQNADGGGEPKPLQLTSTPAEFFTFIQSLNGMMDELSMINSTLRGAPPANVTSGAMAATLAAQALEFISSDTKGLTLGIERLMMMSIENYKRFADIQQVIDVVGEGNISSIERFKGESLQAIKKVKVRQGNPMMNTISGRLQLAESILPLLQSGNYAAVQKYFSIIEGAPVETLFDVETSENSAVQQEIESLQRGENVFPIASQNHPLFIKEYQKLMYNPKVVIQGELTQTILSLMLTRLNMEMTMDPNLKAILRGLPMPQMMPQAKPQGPASEAAAAPDQTSGGTISQPSQPLPQG